MSKAYNMYVIWSKNPNIPSNELAKLTGTTTKYAYKMKTKFENGYVPTGNPIVSENDLHKMKSELKFYKKKYEELLDEHNDIQQILESLYSIVSPFKEIEIPFKEIKKDSSQELDCVFIFSDWHVGEKVNTEINKYDLNVATSRVGLLYEKIYDFFKSQTQKFSRAYIFVLGDMVSGAIHEDLIRTNVINEIEQTVYCAHLLAYLIRDISTLFEKTFVFTVVGNHGRTTKKPLHKEIINNLDYITYRTAEILLKDYKKIEFHISKQKNIIVGIDGYNVLLSHGDNIKTWAGIPYYGIERMINKVKTAYMSTGINIFGYIQGHLHTPFFEFTTPNTFKIVNGALKGIDEYAMNGGYFSKPCQLMLPIYDGKFGEHVKMIWINEDEESYRYIELTSLIENE